MFPDEFKSTEKPTHLLLNGGKLSVPQEREREFIEKYAKALTLKQKLYIVECRPAIFKFMIDLDIKDPENSPPWTKDKILDLVATIQKVIFEFYEVDINVICLTCPTKIVTSKKTKYTKIGIHLIWPRHFVNASDAIVLRQAIILKLCEKYGERHPENPWSDVFDERIYTSNGYRMVGSDKYTRGISENREYWPLFVIDSVGNSRDAYFNRISTDMEALVIDTSIRFVPVKIAIPFTKIPKWVTIDEETKQKIQKKTMANKITRMDMCTKEYEVLIKFMGEKLPQIYSSQKIKSIQRYPDDNILIITDSRHCMNIGREHNSCGIYFFATEKGVYQKCLCPCINMKDRIFGYCKDYTSSCFEFSDEIRSALFRKKKIIKKTKSDLNLSSTQNTSQFKKHLSSFCDDIFNSI